MSCFTTIFLVIGSRIAILLSWLADPPRFYLAFKDWAMLRNSAIPVWVWTLIGGIFMPWTTLAYRLVYPGGIVGYDWISLGSDF
jgi:hypothetical protein